MSTETYEVHQTKCDACGRFKEEPLAVSGYYDSGWRQINEKDLCSVCYGAFSLQMVVALKNEGLLDEMLEEHINRTANATTLCSGTHLLKLSRI